MMTQLPRKKKIVQMSEVKHTKKHEDLVYDVGMHKGEDTAYYLKKGFRVVGFEADPSLAAHCRYMFLDEIENGKLIVVEGAIVELQPGEFKDSTITFYKNKDVSVWNTVASDWARRNEFLGTSNEIIEVPVVDFSECLEQYGIPHYLKIDIEGMDTVCLKSLLHFEQKPDYVSIESEKVLFSNLVDELNLLTRLGYTRFKAIEQSGISHQIEPNPSKEKRYVGYHFQKGSSGLFGEDLPYEWKEYNEILDRYKIIFRRYELFGNYGKLKNYFVGRILLKVIKVLSKLLHKPIPGWYDTHAKHSSVVS
jgi:FkbM family methyltransferase